MTQRAFAELLPIRQVAGLLVMLLALVTTPVVAHSLKDLEDRLLKSEEFFQPVDRLAPDFALVDADGKNVHLTDLRSKIVVLNFIYASCGDVCPLHSVLIAQLQSMINETPMKGQVAFISITTDPKTDRGAVLTEYGPTHGLDPVNWTFLTSPASEPEDATRQLAKAYGVEFTGTDDGEQTHGLVTSVIDRDGHLRGRFHGLRFEPVSLIMFVNALINDVHQPNQEMEQQGDFWSWLSTLVGSHEGVSQWRH